MSDSLLYGNGGGMPSCHVPASIRGAPNLLNMCVVSSFFFFQEADEVLSVCAVQA